MSRPSSDAARSATVVAAVALLLLIGSPAAIVVGMLFVRVDGDILLPFLLGGLMFLCAVFAGVLAAVLSREANRDTAPSDGSPRLDRGGEDVVE